jgi:hypothetical protein
MQRRTDLSDIRAKVNEIVSQSRIARHVRRVELVPDTDGDGDEFIRVEISLSTRSSEYDRDLQALTREIRDAVDELDERFASVRFPDAA